MTTTSSTALPEIVERDLVILLAATTSMYSGTVAGGAEEVPGLLVHFSPQVGGLTEDSAKPLNDAGADPPESDAEIDGHFFAVLELRDGRWWRGKEYADRSKAWAAFERRGATAHASRRN